MRAPIVAQQPTPVFVFAVTMCVGMLLALTALAYVLVFGQAQPATYGAPQPAAQIVMPVSAPAPAAVIADDGGAQHFESATHTAGVYDVVPTGNAAHDPESGAATTGTLMYREP